MNFKRSSKFKRAVSWVFSIPFRADLEHLDHNYLANKYSTPEWFLQISYVVSFAFDEWPFSARISVSHQNHPSGGL